MPPCARAWPCSSAPWACACRPGPMTAVLHRRVDRASIGAIVLDVRMPGISGLTVLEQLLAQGVDQPVILLTGHGTVEMCRRAFKTGAAGFWKPVDDGADRGPRKTPCASMSSSRERHQADQQARRRFAQLSAREREVLGLIVEG